MVREGCRFETEGVPGGRGISGTELMRRRNRPAAAGESCQAVLAVA